MSSLQKWASPIYKSCKVNEDDVFGWSWKFNGLRPRDLSWEKVAEGRMRALGHKLKHPDSRPSALIPLSGPSPICEGANVRRRMLLRLLIIIEDVKS